MEETIGKRIAQNRKRLGLTQDALAEQLGVTAQAVSKWENDQSCPDITTLPRLAEIFGSSTDSLLGHTAKTVHQAQVVQDEDSDEPEGIHLNKGSWSFKWDNSRWGTLAFALWVLLTGGLLLAGKLLHWEVDLWDLLWSSALLMFGASALLGKFSFFSLGCTLFGGYFLADELGILPFRLGWELALPILLILFGISLLMDALKKPKHAKFRISRDGVAFQDGSKTRSQFSTREDGFTCDMAFGSNTHYVDLPRLRHGHMECSFGELTVDLSGCEEIAEDCALTADCSFGQLNILVPQKYRVEPNTSTAFGNITTTGQPDSDPQGTVLLHASASFGEIQVRYV